MTTLTTPAMEWLEERGLDLDICEKRGLTSDCPPGGSDHKWICVPFFRGDNIVNRKYRRLDQKIITQDKGGAQIFWNEAALDDRGLHGEPLLITEGEWDALALMTAGFQRVVSVPSGAPNADRNTDTAGTGAKYRFVHEAVAKLDNISRIILAVDADANGYALLEDLSTMLGPARCKFLRYPNHCKDANDVLIRFGAEALQACVSGARWVNVAGVRRFSEYPPGSDADPVIWRPDVAPSFNKRCGIMPGYTSIWTGIPNHGKSTLLNQCTWSLCEQEPDFKAAIAALEIMPNRDYRRIALQYRIGRPKDGGPGGTPPWTRQEIDEGMEWLERHIIPIDPNGYTDTGGAAMEDVEPTLDWFLDAAQTAIVRYGCKLVGLDPWGDLIQVRERGESEHDFIGRALSRMNRLARILKAHIAIVAHPRKIESSTRGVMRAPGPYEIAGSSYFFNKTSLGITVHRDPELDEDTGEPKAGDTRTRVAIWKSKFHDVQGEPGSSYLRFSPARARFDGA